MAPLCCGMEPQTCEGNASACVSLLETPTRTWDRNHSFRHGSPTGVCRKVPSQTSGPVDRGTPGGPVQLAMLRSRSIFTNDGRRKPKGNTARPYHSGGSPDPSDKHGQERQAQAGVRPVLVRTVRFEDSFPIDDSQSECPNRKSRSSDQLCPVRIGTLQEHIANRAVSRLPRYGG